MKLVKKLLELSQKGDVEERAAGVTDVGRTRALNEDYFIVNPDKNLFIVADGMGGHNAGDVASKHATKLTEAFLTPDLLREIRGNHRKIRDTIIKAVLQAHEKVYNMAEENPEYEGMGCTLVLALILGNYLHVCHVGDARAYLCTHDRITLLTRDHSFVMDLVQKGKLTMEEARISPMKNKLHQALGASRTIRPDYKHYILKDNDKILLCSDGLWDMLTDEQLFITVNQNQPVRKLCETLIKQANNAGGHDNITAVVIQHQEKEDGDVGMIAMEEEEPELPAKTGEYSFVFKDPTVS